MPSVADIAKEMGVDLAALDPKFVTRLDTEYTTSESRKTQADQAVALAEQTLRKAEEERAQINDFVTNYGATEETTRRLKAINAAQGAALKALKDNGVDIGIDLEQPNPTPNPNPNPAFDPKELMNPVHQGFQEIGNAMFASNKYFQIFGKPMPDDIRVVAREARDMKKPVEQYIAEKYGFAAEEKRQSDLRQAEHDKQVGDAAVAKWKENNPSFAGHPELNGGAESRNTVIVKPREAADLSKFAGLPTASKIANSVARGRAAISEQRS